MVNQAIQLYESHGVVATRHEIELASRLRLNYLQTNKFYIMMDDEVFNDLISLIDEEGDEKTIRTLLRMYLWDDIEPYVPQSKKDYIKSLF
jgi:hypothetical protein